MARYLVVANQTLGGEQLADEINRRIEAGASSFYVVVPMAPVQDASVRVGMEMADTGVAPSVLSDLGGKQASAERTAEGQSRARLDRLLATIRAAGGNAEGDIGRTDPLDAIADAIAEGPFDEIIISTLPAGPSRWLRMDVPSRVERRFGLPVTTITAPTSR